MQGMLSMKRYFLLILIASAAIAVVGCSQQKQDTPKAEAEKIATEALQEYCRKEGLSFSQFPPPEVLSEPGLGCLITLQRVCLVT